MKAQDAELARLLAGLDARGAWAHTTLLLVSDHGMAKQGESADPMVPLAAEGIGGRFLSGGPFGFVTLDDPARAADAAAAIDALAGRRGVAVRRRAGGVPLPPPRPHRRRLRARRRAAPARRRRASLLDLRYALADLFGRTTGAHGYDPAGTPDMNGVFLALGRGVPAGRRIRPRARARRRADRRAPPRHRAAARLRGGADRGDRRRRRPRRRPRRPRRARSSYPSSLPGGRHAPRLLHRGARALPRAVPPLRRERDRAEDRRSGTRAA